ISLLFSAVFARFRRPCPTRRSSDLTSGASGGDTGVAGSFALNYSTTDTEAVLPGSTKLDAGSGDIVIKAQNNSSATVDAGAKSRSEEHTSELQSRENLVCRLLLEKK